MAADLHVLTATYLGRARAIVDEVEAQLSYRLGQAVAAVADDATAFSHRDVGYMFFHPSAGRTRQTTSAR